MNNRSSGEGPDGTVRERVEAAWSLLRGQQGGQPLGDAMQALSSAYQQWFSARAPWLEPAARLALAWDLTKSFEDLRGQCFKRCGLRIAPFHFLPLAARSNDFLAILVETTRDSLDPAELSQKLSNGAMEFCRLGHKHAHVFLGTGGQAVLDAPDDSFVSISEVRTRVFRNTADYAFEHLLLLHRHGFCAHPQFRCLRTSEFEDLFPPEQPGAECTRRLLWEQRMVSQAVPGYVEPRAITDLGTGAKGDRPEIQRARETVERALASLEGIVSDNGLRNVCRREEYLQEAIWSCARLGWAGAAAKATEFQRALADAPAADLENARRRLAKGLPGWVDRWMASPAPTGRALLSGIADEPTLPRPIPMLPLSQALLLEVPKEIVRRYPQRLPALGAYSVQEG